VRGRPASRSEKAPRSEATIAASPTIAADSVYEYVSGTWDGNQMTSGRSAAISAGKSASPYSPCTDSGSIGRCATGSETAPRMRNDSGRPRARASSAQATTTRSPFSGDSLPRVTTRVTRAGVAGAASAWGSTVIGTSGM
jgi:hypothetical protein